MTTDQAIEIAEAFAAEQRRLACPSCGNPECRNFACEDDGDLLFEIPAPEESQQRVYLCAICHQNGVNPFAGEDTCGECRMKQ